MNISTWFSRLREPVHRLMHIRHHDPEPPQDALDDIAREAHMRLLDCSFEQLGESPTSSLMRMVANVAQEQHERPADSSMEWPSPDGLLDARIRRMIDAMPARRRAMLLLHAQQGLTFRQVAQRFEISDSIALREIGAAYCELRKVMR